MTFEYLCYFVSEINICFSLSVSVTINDLGGEGGHPAGEEGAVALHQHDAQPLEQVVHSLCLVAPRLKGKLSSQGLHNLTSLLVETTQTFKRQGVEDESFLKAVWHRLVLLPGVCMSKGSPSSGIRPHHQGLLEAADHCHIQGCVLPIGPVGKEHICWSCIGTRQQSQFLSSRSETCLGSSMMEDVSEIIVPHDSLSMTPTGNGMVTKCVTLHATYRAEARGGKDLNAQPVVKVHLHLLGLHVESQGLGRYCVQPGSSFW